MIETIAVWIIVGIVIILAGKSIFRTVSGRSDSCRCGMKSCSSSPLCHQPTALRETDKK